MPTARELSWQFTGEGFHYLGDVGNQIHTVQVGLYDFFVDAALERLKMGLLSGGGYLGKMRSLGSMVSTSCRATTRSAKSSPIVASRLRWKAKRRPKPSGCSSVPTEDDPEFAKSSTKHLPNWVQTPSVVSLPWCSPGR